MNQALEKRKKIYNKLSGHCAYCGNEIKFKDMQVDHMNPQCLRGLNMVLFEGVLVDKTHDIENLAPCCRRCNHYKRGDTVEAFRKSMRTLDVRIRNNYINKVAIDYGIITVVPFDGLFHFEKVGLKEIVNAIP